MTIYYFALQGDHCDIFKSLHLAVMINSLIILPFFVKIKVATDTIVLYLQTRYRSKYACIFISSRDTIHRRQICKFCISEPIQDTKCGGSFWFGPIHPAIHRNLGSYPQQGDPRGHSQRTQGSRGWGLPET